MAKFAYNKKCNDRQVPNRVVLFFINLVIIYSISTVSITEGKSDKWDENVRPKLFFDYLKESSAIVDESKEAESNQGKPSFLNVSFVF